MRNHSRTKKITITMIMGSVEFRLGYEDYHAGRDFAENYETALARPKSLKGSVRLNAGSRQRFYERGRQFAATGYHGPLKRGNHVLLEARRALVIATKSGAIC